MRSWLPGLDVVIMGTGGFGPLNRAVFSAALQQVRPVTLHVVGAGDEPAVRAVLGSLMEVAGDACLQMCEAVPEGARRYRATLAPGDVIYPEGWQMLIAALERSDAAMAAGNVLMAQVRWQGNVPYVATKRPLASTGLQHGTVIDRTRAGGCCRIDAVVGETWRPAAPD